jgi:hypothetical protein
MSASQRERRGVPMAREREKGFMVYVTMNQGEKSECSDFEKREEKRRE